jgi:hypothetical protein
MPILRFWWRTLPRGTDWLLGLAVQVVDAGGLNVSECCLVRHTALR